MTWRPSWSYVLGPALVTVLLLAALPAGVASRYGWVAGGATAGVIGALGAGVCWTLYRVRIVVSDHDVLVRNVFFEVTMARASVVAVSPERDGVDFYCRDRDGYAVVTAAAAQGVLAGFLPKSRVAVVARQVSAELGVGEPNDWQRRNARRR